MLLSFSTSVRAQPFPSGVGGGQVHGVKSRDGDLWHGAQGRHQKDVLMHKAVSVTNENPFLYLKELGGVEAAVSSRKTKVLVRFNKLSFLFSWTVNEHVNMSVYFAWKNDAGSVF